MRERPVIAAGALLVLAIGCSSTAARAEAQSAEVAAGTSPEVSAAEPSDGQTGEEANESSTRLRPTWVVPRRSVAVSGESSTTGVDERATDESVSATDSADKSGANDSASDEASSVESAASIASEPAERVDVPPRAEDKDWRSQARIVIHGSADAERLSELVAGLLSDLGASDVEQREVAVTVKQDHIRYFWREDAPMARQLASELDDVFGRVGLRPLTSYRPSPREGLLELWLR